MHEQPHPCSKPAGHYAPDRCADIQNPHTATKELRPRGRPPSPPQTRAPPKPESAPPLPRNRQRGQPRSPITRKNRPSKRNRSTPIPAIALKQPTSTSTLSARLSANESTHSAATMNRTHKQAHPEPGNQKPYRMHRPRVRTAVKSPKGGTSQPGVGTPGVERPNQTASRQRVHEATAHLRARLRCGHAGSIPIRSLVPVRRSRHSAPKRIHPRPDDATCRKTFPVSSTT